MDTGSVDGTTPSLEKLREIASSSLFAVGQVYTRRSNGDLQFTGVRPGPGWEGHGYFSRGLWVLHAGRLKHVRIWKHRWLDRTGGTGTCHSRPPDEMGQLSVCALVYVLALFGWLSAPCGLQNHEPIWFDLKTTPSRRTLQRWLQRALPKALETQQAYRLAVIERCEPRPVESLFPRGLSPPEWPRRPWRDPPLVGRLWRAHALILGAAVTLRLPAALLLAEARDMEADAKNSAN